MKRRTVNITTPWRKRCVQRLARRSYRSAASTLLRSPIVSSRILKELIKTIKSEMRDARAKCGSMLMKSDEELKVFSWERIEQEMETKLPTLIALLRGLGQKSGTNTTSPVICMICCMLLKQSYPKMSLVQRAMSVLLYGNAVSKQVGINQYNN